MSEELPEGWMITSLGSLLREPLRNGHSAKASPSGKGIRTLSLSAVTCGDFSLKNTKVTVAAAGRVKDLWLKQGDLLIERSNTPELVGTSRLYRGPDDYSIFPDLIIRARVHDAVAFADFVELALQAEQTRRYFKESAQGSAGSMPKIDQGVIERTRISLPPLAEQRRIVAKVEELLAQVNAAKDRLAKLPAILKRFRQSVLAAACSGKLTEDWRLAAQIEGVDPPENHDLPSGWRATDLGSLIDGFEAGRSLRAEGRPAGKAEYGVLKISAVTWGTFLPNENKALLPPAAPRPHEVVRGGDLLISRANTSDLVGAVVLVEKDHPQLMLPDKLLRLKVRDALVDRRFLVHALRAQAVRDYFAANATGTSHSMRNLAQPKIAAAPVGLPPLAEQREIVGRIEAIFSGLDRLEDQVSRAATRADRLTQAVLAKAFLGELVPTEASLAAIEGREYESAEQLLARVHAVVAPDSQSKTKRTPTAARRRQGRSSPSPRSARR